VKPQRKVQLISYKVETTLYRTLQVMSLLDFHVIPPERQINDALSEMQVHLLEDLQYYIGMHNEYLK
jgi:hypothetical protein